MGVDYVSEPEGNVYIVCMNKTQKEELRRMEVGGLLLIVSCFTALELTAFFQSSV